jgi:hypothetical protein
MTLFTSICGVITGLASIGAGVFFVYIEEKEVGETLMACGLIMTGAATYDLYKKFSHNTVQIDLDSNTDQLGLNTDQSGFNTIVSALSELISPCFFLFLFLPLIIFFILYGIHLYNTYRITS